MFVSAGRPLKALPFLVLAFLVACSSPAERAASYVASAQKLLDAGDFKKAKVEAQNAVQIEPKNAKARWILAQLAEKDGDLGQVLGNLEIAIAEDPQNLPARVKLGTLLIYGQDYEGAKLLSDAAIQLAPEDPTARLLRARVYFTQNDAPNGIADLDFVLSKQPDNVEAMLLRDMAIAEDDPDKGLAELAGHAAALPADKAKPLREARIQVLTREKRWDPVEKELKAMVADYPLGGYSLKLADFYTSRNRPAEAEQALRAAVAADPDNLNLKISLAQFQSRVQRKPEVAEQTILGFIKESPDNLDLPLVLGTFYEGLNRDPDAVVWYETVAKKSPKSDQGIAARNRLGALRLRAGDLDGARTIYEAVLADVPDNAAALTARGEINFTAGRYADAVADFRGALRKAPDQPDALILLARTHARMGDSSLAEDAYRRLLQLDPGNVEASLELGRLLAAGDQGAEAADIYRQVLKADPKNLEALNGLAGLQLVAGDLAAAEATARALAALNDPKALGDLRLGEIAMARKQFGPARDAFERVLAKSPNEALALDGALQALVNLNQAGQIPEFLRGYLKKHPGNTLATVRLGESLNREGRFEESRGLLEDLLAQNPGVIGAYTALAGTWPRDPAERMKALERGLKVLPGVPGLQLPLAAEYELAGRYDDALALYDAVLKANPKSLRAANGLAALLLDQRKDPADFRRALDVLQPWVDTRDPAVQDTLGWAYYRLGDYDRAVTFLELAAASGAPVPVLRYHLGMTYLAQKNTVGARQEFEKALQLSQGGSLPGVAEAKAELDKLGPAPAAAPKAGG